MARPELCVSLLSKLIEAPSDYLNLDSHDIRKLELVKTSAPVSPASESCSPFGGPGKPNPGIEGF